MATDRLLVSTIIPTHNRAHLVGRAVASALEESGPDDEVIVVDDGSTDNTAEALAPYLDRIRYIRIPNSGAGAARNRAVREARCDLVALLDSDDEWLSGKLELQRRLMAKRPEVLFCFTDFVSILSDGTTVRHALKHWIQESRSWDEILSPGILYSEVAQLPDGIDNFAVYIGDINPSIVRSNYINTDTLIVRRREAGNSLQFAEDLPLYEEQVCYGLLARTGLTAYLDVETVRHHSHPGPRLTSVDALLESSTRIEVTERVWGRCSEYVEKYGELYKQVIDSYREKRAASLISLGRTSEARTEHRLMDRVPLTHRVLAWLPGPVAAGLLRMRRAIRSLLERE